MKTSLSDQASPIPAVVALASILAAAMWASATDQSKEYRSEGGYRVVIRSTSKPETTQESKIQFYSDERNLLCTLDYSSDDHEHGYGVVKAAWTPDQKYFAFSLTSSGGHQPWHAPTMFFSVRDAQIFNLDEYVSAATVSKGGFDLEAPNLVVTEVLRGKSEVVSFRLDTLIRKAHGQASDFVFRRQANQGRNLRLRRWLKRIGSGCFGSGRKG